MKVKVWYHTKVIHGKVYHCFASMYDECNYCYPIEQYTYGEACARYEADHEREGFQYRYINESEN